MSPSSIRKASCVASLLLLAGCVSSSGAAHAPFQTVVADRMTQFLAESEAHAVSVSISYQGEGYTIHEGTLTPGGSAKPTDSNFYEIASITKTFTGIIAAQAVLDGELSLDDDIRRYLDRDYPNLEFDGEPIRVRHLLTHTSGLPANAKGMNLALQSLPRGDASGALWRVIYDANREETRESFIEYLGEIRLTDPPGSTFEYSNYGTNLMAHILENVTDKPYRQLLSERIFVPAGMTSATLRLRPEHEAWRALGYNQAGERIPRLPIADVLWGADGGVKATAPDMLRYLQWVLADRSTAVAESKKRLDRRDEGYWLGYFWWVIDTQSGARSYRHDGGGAGVRNVLIIYPEDDLAIYAVTNKTTPEMNGQLTSMVQSIRTVLLQE